jgi:hypothetical protein
MLNVPRVGAGIPFLTVVGYYVHCLSRSQNQCVVSAVITGLVSGRVLRSSPFRLVWPLQYLTIHNSNALILSYNIYFIISIFDFYLKKKIENFCPVNPSDNPVSYLYSIVQQISLAFMCQSRRRTFIYTDSNRSTWKPMHICRQVGFEFEP